jgi:precorrin-8X/cobalt-precorrin-8 methylmutase
MPILCDCEMVRAGIIAKHLSGSERVVTLNHPEVSALASTLSTTRSAAAVELWKPLLAGAVVVIGNAPTALFHLLDLIAGLKLPSPLRGGAEGGGLAVAAGLPAAIIAAPVGFVGASESKARLIAEAPVPYITVTGRRGGSAIASAAFNAIAGASA